MNLPATHSTYNLGAGASEITVLSDGTFAIPPGALSANLGEEPAKAWLSGRMLPVDEVTNPLNVAVVRLGERVVLIDSGLGDIDAFGPTAGKLFDRLSAAGIEPGAITDLALTHLHGDHFGGALAMHERGLLRADLRVHVSRVELDFWSGDTTAAFRDYRPGVEMGAGMTEMARGFLSVFGDRIEAFEDGAEVIPGLRATLTPGHTPGHAIYRLESGGERFIFIGDAVNAAQFENPGWHFFFDTDPERAVASRRGLLDELARDGTLIAATHVPFPALGRVSVDGEAYRFNPIVWQH